jgi:hypothetical protein
VSEVWRLSRAEICEGASKGVHWSGWLGLQMREVERDCCWEAESSPRLAEELRS